ncbi:uncharacterized protein LOC144471388 [Augochlora pura]
METDKVIIEKVTENISHKESEKQISENKENKDVQPIVLSEVEIQSYRNKNKESSSEDSSSDEDDFIWNRKSLVSNNNIRKKQTDTTKKSKSIMNEFEKLPMVEDLEISMPEVLCDPVGKIAWMVEQLVIVQPKPEKPTLDLDTVLFVDKGKKALGKIFDVFGHVSEPYYCVRFNDVEHIRKREIKVGMTVYYCPNTQHTSLLSLFELLKVKGVDANPNEARQFSDDEEERAYHGISQLPIPFPEATCTDSDTDESSESSDDEKEKVSSEKLKQAEKSANMDKEGL